MPASATEPLRWKPLLLLLCRLFPLERVPPCPPPFPPANPDDDADEAEWPSRTLSLAARSSPSLRRSLRLSPLDASTAPAKSRVIARARSAEMPDRGGSFVPGDGVVVVVVVVAVAPLAAAWPTALARGGAKKRGQFGKRRGS
jgi:hypothetical protein